uniref:Uncharacterized protein n=1 Tax=Anguilla anguilla TaxID=7936 RepID=A0A0E9SJU2_ANGAN
MHIFYEAGCTDEREKKKTKQRLS